MYKSRLGISIIAGLFALLLTTIGCEKKNQQEATPPPPPPPVDESAPEGAIPPEGAVPPGFEENFESNQPNMEEPAPPEVPAEPQGE